MVRPAGSISFRNPWVAMLGLALLLAALAGSGWWFAEQERRQWAAATGELDAEIVGNDYQLHVRYPGPDQRLHTPDDRFGTRDLHVPGGARVRVQLRSIDYVYLIEIPVVGIYEVAAPDLEFEFSFVAPQSGVHEFLGSEMCGYDHSGLLGKLRVQSSDEFVRTMKRLPQVPPDLRVHPSRGNPPQ
jgi:cytochrome c oxidase subunit 2